MVIGVGALAGCQPEERIVNYRPFFSGLEGVRTGQPEVRDGKVVSAGTRDASEMSMEIVVENEDGSVTLLSKSGSHLMRHIQRTLHEDERELFVEQVLSEVTRREFEERGLDPTEAFDQLKEHEREIAELFARMPLGEHTPQVIMKKVGRNTFRVRVTGMGTDALYWRGYDMVLEGGNWRLRWMVR
jgi:hypothetical protein